MAGGGKFDFRFQISDFRLIRTGAGRMGLMGRMGGRGLAEKMRVYVASSWRNGYQPLVVEALRGADFEVYDFRNPPEGSAFAWSEIDAGWQSWTTAEYAEALCHPLAEAGYDADMEALEACDICVLVMPSGRSAHLEAGHAAGAGKHLVILIPQVCDAELMYKMGEMCFDVGDVVLACEAWRDAKETDLFPDGDPGE